MNRPECESERLIYSLETSSKLQLLFENSAVGETYLFHRIASDCLRIPRFSIGTAVGSVSTASDSSSF